MKGVELEAAALLLRFCLSKKNRGRKFHGLATRREWEALPEHQKAAWRFIANRLALLLDIIEDRIHRKGASRSHPADAQAYSHQEVLPQKVSMPSVAHQHKLTTHATQTKLRSKPGRSQ